MFNNKYGHHATYTTFLKIYLYISLCVHCTCMYVYLYLQVHAPVYTHAGQRGCRVTPLSYPHLFLLSLNLGLKFFSVMM